MPAFILGLAIFLYAVGFSYLTITRYAAFEARALDLGNLHQTVWNSAQGRPFHMTNQPGTVNRLSLHVEPIILPIATLYWLHDGPETLLILQSIVVALGAWPLFALARYRLHNDWLALLFGTLFLLNPTIQAANWLEFHPVTLAPTFLMAAFYFLISKRTGWFISFAILAASCKEEIGLLMAMVGLYALVALRRPRLGFWTFALSLSWSLFAVLGIQHFFADGNIHWGRYDYLGTSPIEKVQSLFRQPQLIWTQLQRVDALGYLFRLLWPVGFVALLAPEVLLLALPSLAINLLADFPPMHQVYELIYAAPILPFVMLAMVEGMSRVAGSRQPMTARLRDSAITRNRAIFSYIFKIGIPIAVVGGTLFAHYLHGYLPGGGNFQHFPITDHDRRAEAIIAQIPPDAKVSAQDRLDPHVAGRETIYIFPRVDDADTIFVDVTGPAWPLHPSDLQRELQQLLAGDFGVTAGDDGYLLLRKDAPTDLIPSSFYSAFRRSPSTGHTTTQKTSIFGEALVLREHQLHVDEHGEIVVQLFWQLLDQPVGSDYQFYVAFADRDGNLIHDTLFYPPVATLWYPTSLWQRDEVVMVETLPWQLDVDQFTLLIGLYEGDDGWHKGKRLPLQTDPTAARLHLEKNTLARVASYKKSGAGWEPVAVRNQLMQPTTQLDVHIGNEQTSLSLAGILLEEIPKTGGDELSFALEWRAGPIPISFDYAIFGHLLNAQDEKVAQLDWQPQDDWGPRPMTTWLAEEVIIDQQSLRLPDTLAAGNYRLLLGVYNWQTGERLAISGSDVTADDTATVAHFSIQ